MMIKDRVQIYKHTLLKITFLRSKLLFLCGWLPVYPKVINDEIC